MTRPSCARLGHDLVRPRFSFQTSPPIRSPNTFGGTLPLSPVQSLVHVERSVVHADREPAVSRDDEADGAGL